MSGQAGLSNWFCLSIWHVIKSFEIVIVLTGDLEATISQRQVNIEIRCILAYVYLVKHKAVLFSTFSTFFLIMNVVHHFNMQGFF